MDAALEKADWAGLRPAPRPRPQAARQAARHRHGLLHRIDHGRPARRRPRSSSRTTARSSVAVGTQSNGQGHETAYAQSCTTGSASPFEKIRIVQGDTDRAQDGRRHRRLALADREGMAIRDAADDVIERGQAVRGAGARDRGRRHRVRRDGGEFRVVGTDRRIDPGARREGARDRASPPGRRAGGLDAEATAKIDAWTFPNGCHIAEVEIDPDTGVVEIVRYIAVDDFGVVINPMLVAGQVHGGVVQGIGQALLRARGLRRRAASCCPARSWTTAMPRADGPAGDRGLDHRGALQEQPARRQGLRRGRLGRLAGGGDQRDHRCARRPRRDARSTCRRRRRRSGG